MHFIENVDLIRRLEWQGVHTFDKCANILDAVIARGINFVEIISCASNLAGEDARDRGLSESARTGEEIRVPDFLRLRCLLQGLCYLLLPHHIRERCGTVCSVEGLVRHKNSIKVKVLSIKADSFF